MWLKKPAKEKSVTQTMVTWSFLLLIAANIAQILKYTDTTASLNELFYATLAAYLGKSMTFKGKNVSVNEEKKEE